MKKTLIIALSLIVVLSAFLVSCGKSDNENSKTDTSKETEMSKADMIELEGTVVEAMPNAVFKVEIPGGHQILAHISGKLRMNFIRIYPGDKVTIELSPYDLTRGRITWRSKN